MASVFFLMTSPNEHADATVVNAASPMRSVRLFISARCEYAFLLRMHCGRLLAVRKDHVRSLLADHVNGRDDEEALDFREDRCVHDAKAFGAVDLEIASEHAVARARTDRARTRRVVTPGMRADELLEIRVTLNVLARQLLFFDEAADFRRHR